MGLTRPSGSRWRLRSRAQEFKKLRSIHDDQKQVLAGYVTSSFIQRHKGKALFIFFIFMMLYCAFFTLIGRFILLQFLILPATLALFCIWMLPESASPPTVVLERLSVAYLFALLCWPDYLAFSVSGLPWVTAIRLVGIPLAVVFLICLSTSKGFRQELLKYMKSSRYIAICILLFSFIATISVIFSSDIGASLSKLFLALVNWTLVFFCSVFYFRKPGRLISFAYVLWAVAIFLSLIAFQEWRHSVVPWAGHIPSFLKIEDETVQRILVGSARAATGIYRVQSKFTTPLSFAEFIALVCPFVTYMVIASRNIYVKFLAILTVPIFFLAILGTDSRLGVIGFFSSLLLTSLAWGVLRWTRNRDSLFGPAVVIAFPASLMLFLAASAFVRPLRALMWGSGAEQFSDASRQAQVDAGLSIILKSPWGHGIGRGAATLGFTNLAGVLTIDSYYLSVALEFGVIGFFAYYGAFICGVYYSAKTAIAQKNFEFGMAVPLCISLINFLIIKSVLSQQETHPLAFIILGATVALVYRSCQNAERINSGPPIISTKSLKRSKDRLVSLSLRKR